MRILLIQPNYALINNFFDKLSMKLFMSPDTTLQQIATITPEKHLVEILDDTFKKIKFRNEYDLVGITSCTSSAYKAYKIADKFREIGVKVVLGGYHPSALPHEAKQHADSVVIGEAENSWPSLLHDLENNNLHEFYHSEYPSDISNLPPLRRDIGRNHLLLARLEATRGCPYRCEFCSISNSKIGWHIFRKKPVEKVIEELKLIPQKFLIFSDTSMTIDIEYSISLFEKMKNLNKKFICYGNCNILAKNEILLKKASEAGCVLWNIGFDSMSQEALDGANKKINIVKDYGSVVKNIHDYGMAVLAQIIFGFDAEDKNIFNVTSEIINTLEIDIPAFNILTPFPGTPLYDRLNIEGRILTNDWSKYDLTQVVFQPKNMSSKELQFGYYHIVEMFHNYPNFIKRMLKSIKISRLSSFNTLLSNIYEIKGYKKVIKSIK